jgi:hypothetical protein
VYLSHTKEFVVRLREKGKILWQVMTKNQLKKVLEAKSMQYHTEKKTVNALYSVFLDHPMITQDTVNFGHQDFCKTDEDDDTFPVWTGFGFPVVDVIDLDILQPFLDHVKNIICGGNQLYYETEMKKNAWIVQNPLLHMGWATVLVGQQGTGKNRYTDILCALWGEKNSQPNVDHVSFITAEKGLTLVHYKKIVVINELPELNSRQGKNTEWETLKSRITDDTLTARRMYHDFAVTPERNVSNYFFCTNNVHSVQIPEGDRRYFVLAVSDAKKGDTEYFAKLVEMKSDPTFLSNLLSYLLKLDTTGLNVYQPLETELKKTMMESQEPLPLRFIKRYDLWREIKLPNRKMEDSEWTPFTSAIWRPYRQWIETELDENADRVGGTDNYFARNLTLEKWIERRGGNPAAYRPGERLIAWKKEEDKRAAELAAQEAAEQK